MRDKKAQFESKLIVIITIFIIGILLFFMNHMNNKVYDQFNEYLSGSEYNGTEAQTALSNIQELEQSSIWDYAFLAIFIGLIIQLVVFSFASRMNMIFYWLMVVIDLPILIVGVIVSNVWQELSSNAEFVTTLARFPITNSILGSYFPMAVVIIFFIVLVVMFGKPPEGEFR